MGKAWDNDPRIAYIDMGLIGLWGEHHHPSVNSEMQKLLGDAFTSAFKTKLIMIRYTFKDFKSYPFGNYWDSFAHPDEAFESTSLIAQGGKWKTAVRGGEVAYNWGDKNKQKSLMGANATETLKTKAYRNYMIDNIRTLHQNHLGFIRYADYPDHELQQGVDEIQKNLGYRFVLDEVSYTPNVSPGGTLKVRFIVRNIGSSPFYYNWPIEVSLLNPDTKQPVWKAVFQNLDIRKWLPGDQWDKVLRKYTIEPEKNVITGEFKISRELKKGEYILALSILDPGGYVPAARFAVKNYFNGGRHPIGKIGVKKALGSFNLNETAFDDLNTDRTLYYEFK